jgi:hypothetical protein
MRRLCMMPTGRMRMMRGFLVPACLMVFGSFLVMPRGVRMLFRCVIVMLCSFGRHGQPPCKAYGQHRPASAPRSVAV